MSSNYNTGRFTDEQLYKEAVLKAVRETYPEDYIKEESVLYAPINAQWGTVSDGDPDLQVLNDPFWDDSQDGE
jgi:hypothetical protein